MDGADTIDRQRLRRTHDVENETPEKDGWDEWFGIPSWTPVELDSAISWWSAEQDRASAAGPATVASGCGGECPFCKGTVYEEEADKMPLTFWTVA